MTDRQDHGPSGKTYRLAELAARLDALPVGDPDLAITGVNDLADAKPGDISFITSVRYLGDLKKSAASAVVAGQGIDVDRPAIFVDRPDLAFAQLLDMFTPPPPNPIGVHPTAVVDTMLPATVAVGTHACIGKNTAIGENTVVHANVTIGPDVTIGADGLIWPGAVIRERVTIGDRVIIGPNTTIGGDGFGYNLVDGRHRKIAHIGTVEIGDDVELGANVCVDRAKAGTTVIGDGCKVDNLVQIGHNVKIGPNSILVAHVAIGGSVTIGKYVALGGHVAVREHVTVGDKSQAAGCCCISKNIAPGSVVNGIPAIDNREFLRQQTLVRRLPRLVEKLDKLTRQVHELEQTIHDLKRSRT